MTRQPWKEYIRPDNIFGNLYFVGTRAASSHLIDTGNGLILLDAGYPEDLYLVLYNIHELGFDIHDLCYILLSHGHYDHIGATRALTELTGAKTILGAADTPIADGTIPLSLAEEVGGTYTEFFTPDIPLHDGDEIALGRTRILCRATPGHSDGTMSFFFDVSDGSHTYRAGMHGGVGTNTMTDKFLKDHRRSSECRQEFLRGLDRIEGEHVDITLGNHTWNNRTEEKLAQRHTASRNPFIDPAEWRTFLAARRAKVQALIDMET